MGLNLDNSIISTQNVYAAQKILVGPEEYTYNLQNLSNNNNQLDEIFPSFSQTKKETMN